MSSEFLSRRVLELEPSATMAMNAKAKKLAAEGKNVISFSVGEPDFNTPQHICDAAKQAIDAGMHGYTAVGGTPELKKAIATALTRDTGVEYKPDQVVASPGGKYSLYLILMALINPGDEVIIPAPYWVSYPEMVRLVGGVPVIVNTNEEDLFAVRPEALEAAITPKTKAIILNSPSNPTGQIVPPEVIGEIGRIMEKKGIWCISDEIYNHLIFGDAQHKSVASVSDYCRDHTVVANGCSKTYAMTGWRLGWIGAPKAVAKAIEDLQGQTCSNPCTIAQAAAVAAINGSQDSVKEMAAQFDRRRGIIYDLLNGIEGFSFLMPQGAFYALPNISGVFGKTIGGVTITSPLDFCTVALEKAQVAMVPGEAFGAPNHIRLSYATSEDNIREGCRRLKALVEGTL
ncbi:MAG: pyridoxal phosphate-dependent aminotransferase [Planctomycetaceae bacterium]|nr:pyridoxal phosphate-dependent aminotransferase [Planctomycetaceae bacterium]